MVGIYYWRAPLTPLLSSAVVICVCSSTYYLFSLLPLPLLSASVSFVTTHTCLTQQFISIPNLWERMSSGVLTPCKAACINICTLIWPCLSSSIHPDIDWFSQQVSVCPIWLMWGVCEGGDIEPGCPTCQQCVTPLSKKSPGRSYGGQGNTWAAALSASKSISHRIKRHVSLKHLNCSWNTYFIQPCYRFPVCFLLRKSGWSIRVFVMFPSTRMSFCWVHGV